jgi:hypothetical protein
MSAIPSFDVVIPVGPNDIAYVWRNIARNKENIVGFRNLYIVTRNPESLNSDIREHARLNQCILINEDIFPFRMSDVIAAHKGATHRNGWYLQQLIKLYAGFVIPDILPRYLIVDADTVFLKRTTFVSEDNKCLMNVGVEYHMPYFEHMRKLHPALKREIHQYSGISHHMMFETKYVRALIDLIEAHHGGEKSFWNLFLDLVSESERLGSGASEYEMYFNFMLQYHRGEIVIRPLQWRNASRLIEDRGLDYISIHHYMRAE